MVGQQTGGTRAICPNCGNRISIDRADDAGRVTCACGKTLALKREGASALAERAAMYGSRISRKAKIEAEGHDSSDFANRYFPLALGGVGAVLWVVQVLFRPLGHSIATGAVLSVVMLVVSLVVMTCGVMLASKFFDADFGSLGQALLKLAATAVFVAAVFALIASLDFTSARGPILAWHAAILVYLCAFKTMFDLDLVEALMTSAIVGVLLAITALVIFQTRG